MTRVAINGFGRIGRAVCKILLQNGQNGRLDLVAINDLTMDTNLAYLLKYDTVYGRFEKEAEARGEQLVIGGRPYRLLHERDPLHLPWRDLGIDLVFECTGALSERADLEKHRKAGARYVLLSAPAQSPDIETVVHGVNRPDRGSDGIFSCASSTTNAIAPICEILDRRLGVHKAAMTTVHAYTATQSVVDGLNKKLRRAPRPRRGRLSRRPRVRDQTGNQRAGGEHAAGRGGRIGSVPGHRRRDGRPHRLGRRDPGPARLHRGHGDEDRRGEDLVKVMAWYDNEWGYASQMVREAGRLVQV